MGVRVAEKLESKESREELGTRRIEHNLLPIRVYSSWKELEELRPAW